MCFFNLTFYSAGCYFFQEFCFMGLFKESVDLTSVIIRFIYCFLSFFFSFFWTFFLRSKISGLRKISKWLPVNQQHHSPLFSFREESVDVPLLKPSPLSEVLIQLVLSKETAPKIHKRNEQVHLFFFSLIFPKTLIYEYLVLNDFQ